MYIDEIHKTTQYQNEGISGNVLLKGPDIFFMLKRNDNIWQLRSQEINKEHHRCYI